MKLLPLIMGNVVVWRGRLGQRGDNSSKVVVAVEEGTGDVTRDGTGEGAMTPQAVLEAARERCFQAAVAEKGPARAREVAGARAMWAALKLRWAAKYA